MQIKVMTVVLLACFLGCKPLTPTERLLGKWGLNTECTLALAPDTQDLSAPIMTQLARFVGPALDTMFFDFERDGRLTIQRNHIADEYNYTIVGPPKKDALSLSLSTSTSGANESVAAHFTGDELKLKIKSTTYCLVAL